MIWANIYLGEHLRQGDIPSLDRHLSPADSVNSICLEYSWTFSTDHIGRTFEDQTVGNSSVGQSRIRRLMEMLDGHLNRENIRRVNIQSQCLMGHLVPENVHLENILNIVENIIFDGIL